MLSECILVPKLGLIIDLISLFISSIGCFLFSLTCLVLSKVVYPCAKPEDATVLCCGQSRCAETKSKKKESATYQRERNALSCRFCLFVRFQFKNSYKINTPLTVGCADAGLNLKNRIENGAFNTYPAHKYVRLTRGLRSQAPPPFQAAAGQQQRQQKVGSPSGGTNYDLLHL